MSNYVRRLLLVLALVAGIALSVIIAIPCMRYYRAQNRRMACVKNIQHVADQLRANATVINWNAPDPIGQLVALKLLDPQCARCPNGRRTYGVNTAAFRALIGKTQLTPETVLLFEVPANHEGAGGSFAFADGHAHFVSAKEFKTVLRKGGVELYFPAKKD